MLEVGPRNLVAPHPVMYTPFPAEKKIFLSDVYNLTVPTFKILPQKSLRLAWKTNWLDSGLELHISVELYHSDIIVEIPGERFRKQ